MFLVLLSALGTSTPAAAAGDVYRASGVADGAGIATVVHCTNDGSAATSVTATIRGFSGLVECIVGSPSVTPAGTVTLSTRDTQVFVEHATCAAAPGTDQGSLLISASSAGSGRLLCTVQVVDPAGATPRFLESLELYTAAGVLLKDFIFGADFETGDLSSWSASVP